MELKLFNTKNSLLLKKALETYGLERAAISENIANVNNPRFRRIDTDFSSVLKEEMSDNRLRVTDPKHLDGSKFRTKAQSEVNGEEGVDLTREMSDLAANQIKHEFVSKVLRRYYAGLSSAILGRNR
ncbi:MAG: flagellar basal body rod protein FlgB [FCB group bacterium]|nr:flagellar basal body rod protein FlgB [FCB group bacterium]